MDNVDIFEKGSTQQLTFEKAPQHQSVYEVHVNKDQVSKLTRIDNNLEITLLNGAKIIIPSFFAVNFAQDLVFESEGTYALAKMDDFNSEGVATTVDYLAIDDMDAFLKEESTSSDSSAVPMLAWIAGGALVAGTIAAAANSNDSSNNNGNEGSKPIDVSPPEIYANVKDATHVEVTSNEAGTITITDAQCNLIGTGTAIDGKTEITLTRPLQDNEEIKVIVIDDAGNKSEENILVGDVTAPTIDIEIKDENNITIKSDETGANVVIKNQDGEIIGSGITGSDGTVDIVLTQPVIDGETIIVSVVDNAGNSAEESIIVPDLTAPLIDADVKDATHIDVTSNEAGTIKITDAQGNVIGSGTAIDGKTEITLTRPLENNETIKIIVSDLAGNQAQEDIEVTGIIPPSEDTTAPSLTGSAVNTAGELILSFNEALDDQKPPQLTDFTVLIDGVLRTPDSILINGSDLTLSFTPPIYSGQSVQVIYTDQTAQDDVNAIQDAAGNDALSFNETVDAGDNGSTKTPIVTPLPDTTGPILNSSSINADGKLILSFDEALDDQNPPQLTDFTVLIDGVLRTPDSILINGSDLTLNFTPPIYSGQSVQVIYTDPTPQNDINAIQDGKGNDALGFNETVPVGDNGSTQTPIVTPPADTTGPILNSSSVNTDGDLILSFNEALDDQNPPQLTDFTVLIDGVLRTPDSILINGSDLTLNFTPPIYSGQSVQVIYTDPTPQNDINAIQDGKGNDALGFNETVAVGDNGSTQTPIVTPPADTTGPILNSSSVNTDGDLILSFNEALDDQNPPQLTDFTVLIDGVLRTPDSILINGSDLTLNFTPPIYSGQSVQVIYTDPTPQNDINAIQDGKGNDALGFNETVAVGDNGSTQTPIVTPPADTTGPILNSSSVNTDGDLILSFNEALDDQNPPQLTDFTVLIDGVLRTPDSILINGSDLTLNFTPPIYSGQSVQVIYTDPTPQNDINAIQDGKGNDALGFNETVPVGDNGSTQTPIVTPPADTTGPILNSSSVNTDGDLILSFNEALDDQNPPQLTDFTVLIDGVLRTPDSILINGSDLTLNFTPPIYSGQSVQVIYTDPTPQNDINAIQDGKGNDALGFNETVAVGDNGSTQTPIVTPPADTTGPILNSSSVNTDGDLILSFNEALDDQNPPQLTDFTVLIDGVLRTPDSILINGSDLTLNFTPPIYSGQSVQVIYTDPTPQNDINAIQDGKGNDALGFNETVAVGDNGSTQTPIVTPPADTTGPILNSSSVNTDGDLILSFNEALDDQNPPQLTDFTVLIDGVLRTPDSILINGSDLTLNFTPPIYSGQSVQVIYTDPTPQNDINAIQDGKGNDALGFNETVAVGDNGSTQTPIVTPPADTTGPILNSSSVNTDGDLILSFNEALDDQNPPQLTDFTVLIDGVLRTPDSILINGSDLTLNFTPPIYSGQSVQVIYTDPTPQNDINAIQDGKGNDALGFNETVAVGDNGSTQTPIVTPPADTTGPILNSSSVNTDGDLILSFNEALDDQNPPQLTDFTVLIDGVLRTPDNILINGSDLTLNFTPPIYSGQSVQVIYTDPTPQNDINAIQDGKGNDALGFNETVPVGDNGSTQTPIVTPPADTTGPILNSSSVNTDGDLILSFNEALDDQNPPQVKDFTILIDGVLRTADSISITGKEITLDFTPPIYSGQSVQVIYTDPTAQDDVNAIQDATGNDALSFNETVDAGDNGSTKTPIVTPLPDTTGPILNSSSVNADGKLILSFDETLDDQHQPQVKDFTILIDGVLRTADSISITGKEITLDFTPPIYSGQSVQVIYTDPTAQDDFNAIQDATGNDALSFNETVDAGDNGSTKTPIVTPLPDTTGPILNSSSVNADGKLILSFDETLDDQHQPQVKDFTILIDGVLRTADSISITGKEITLDFTPPIYSGQSVQVIYTDPTAQDDVNAIQDAAGNDALSFNETVDAGDNGSTQKDTTAPTVQGVVKDATHVEVVSNEVGIIEILDAQGTVIGIGIAKDGITEITLKRPLIDGENIEVTVTDSSGNIGSAIIQVGDVTGPTLDTAEVDTLGQLVLTFNEVLNAGNPPKNTDFTVNVNVNVNGVDRIPNTVTINGKEVTLSFVPPIYSGQKVEVSYEDPTVGKNDVNAIQDVVGNDTNSFTETVGLNDSSVIDPSTFKLEITGVYDYVDQVGGTPLITPESIVNGGFSNDASPVITGKAAALSQLTITIDSVNYTVITDASGFWTFDFKTHNPPLILNEGNVVIKITDGTDTLSFNYELDTKLELPELTLSQDTGINQTDFITNNGQIDVSKIEVGATWFYSVKGGAWELGQGASFNLKDDGLYAVGDIKVQVIDKAGNIVEVTYNKALTLDTNPPVPLTATLAEDTAVVGDRVTSNGLLQIGNVEAGTKVYIQIKGGAWTEVIANGNVYSYDLPVGSYAKGDILLKQVDVAGNESVISDLNPIVIDKTANLVTVTLEDTGVLDPTGTTITTKNPIITISNVETGAKLYYTKDNGAAVEIITKDSQGNYILVLPAGNYSANTFNFYQIDLAGNKSINQSLSNFVIDMIIEPVVITDLSDNLNSNVNTNKIPSGSLVNKNDFTLSGTAEAGSSVEISINGVVITTTPVQADATGKWTFDFSVANPALTGFFENGVLKDGNYTITAKSTDIAGNISAPSAGYIVNVDTYIQAPTLDAVTGDDSISSAEYISGVNLSGTAEAGSTVYVEWRNTVSKKNGPILLEPDISASFISDNQIKVVSDKADDTVSIMVNGKEYTATIGSDKTATITLDQAYTGNVDISVIHRGAIINYETKVTISNLDFTTTADANGKWTVPVTGLPSIPDYSSNAHIYVSSKDLAGNPSSTIDRTVPITRTKSATINVIASDDIINGTEWTSLQNIFTVTGHYADDNSLFGSLHLYIYDNTNNKYLDISSSGGLKYVTVNTKSDGTWSVALPAYLRNTFVEGNYTFELKDSILSNTPSLASRPVTFDKTPPIAPLIESIVDQVDEYGNMGVDTTVTINNGVVYTNDNTPKIQGHAFDSGSTGNVANTIKLYLIVNGIVSATPFVTLPINADGTWNYQYTQGLADGTYTIQAVQEDKAGNISGSTTLNLHVDTQAPDLDVYTIANDSSLGVIEIDLKEISDGVEVRGHIDQVSTTITVEINGKKVLAVVDANGNWTAKFTAADLIGLNDGTDYPVKITAVDLAGNQSETTLNAHTKFGHSVELNELDYAGASLVVETDLAVANTTLKLPTAQVQVKGQNVVWSLESGVVLGKVGGEVVIEIKANINGKYEIVLSQGIDHLNSDISTIQIPVETNGVNSQLSIVVHDGEPVVSPVVNIDMTEVGTVSGTFVETFGMDGGHLKSVTIEGNTYVYDSINNTVSQSGSSTTVYAYSYSNDANNLLIVTTVHGNTVKVNMKTGVYEVTASGISAETIVNEKPQASLGDKGGLLGTANVNVAGLIDLSSTQLYTVQDGNNNISKVVINKAALLNLDLGLHYAYSTAMAADFGFKISIIHAFLITPAQISITSLDGKPMDVDRLNEFLGTVKLVSGLGQILDVKLLAGETITATDSNNETGKDTTVDVADVGVLSGLGELVKLQQSGILQEGTANNDTVSGDKSVLSKDDRLYGYDGDDVLDAGEGSDILRGGAGNDTLYAGNGNDILIGGKGNDILWGDVQGSANRFSDVFKWEAGDQGTTVTPSRDVIKDFDKASVKEGGDVLDLSGLLIGEGRIGFSTGNLTNYLHFELVTENGVTSTVISISSSGAYLGGYSAKVAAKTDQVIVLEGVNLVDGVNAYGQSVKNTDQQIIQDLLNKGKLEVDSANINADALTDKTIDMSAQVTDSDGDIKNTGTSSIDTTDVPNIGFIENNVAPTTQVSVGSLLGIINLDALGVINLSQQYLTAYDVDNNLKTVEVKYQPLLTLSLTPMALTASQALAKELGLEFTVKSDDGVLGLIAPSSKLIITAIGGGEIDNLAVNELLTSVYLTANDGTLLNGNLLNVDVLNSISITATDTQGASSSSNVSQLLGLNLLNAGTFNAAKDSILLGTDNDDGSLSGTANADRIYGLNGDDIIHAGAGDDLVRGGLGDDYIDGGAGNDLLLGGAGNDTIIGGLGNDVMLGGQGTDTLTGGAGADLVIFDLLNKQSATGGNDLDTWTDFNIAEGDMIDISKLLVNFKEGQSNIKDFVNIQYDSASKTATVSIDRDGTATGFQSEKLLILQNQNQDITLDDLLNSKNLLY